MGIQRSASWKVSSLSIAMLQAASTAMAAATAACSQLTASFPGQVSLPLSVAYTTTNIAYWDKRCELDPTCIFYPASTSDVSAAVEIFVQTNTSFALKSGGHMANPGFNNIDNGVLVSFENMKSVELNAAGDVVSIQPGLRWGEVYDAADAWDKKVVGGRVPPVGVSGLLLGGGLSYVGFEYGFAADNVVGHEVVLANGSVVYANTTQYADLHKALKGGSSNFGIVTRFDLNAYDTAQGWGGSIIVPIVRNVTDVGPILDAVADFHVNGSQDVKAGAIPEFIYAPDLLVNMFQLAMWYSEVPAAGTDHPAVFDKFYALPGAIITAGPRTIGTLATQSGTGVSENAEQNTFHTRTIQATREAMQEVYDDFFSSYYALGLSVLGLLATVVFQPVSASFIEAGEARGGNVMGLDAGAAPYSFICQTVGWSLASDSDTVMDTNIQVADTYMAWAEENGVASPFIYMNDADATEDIFAGYGEENHAFLKSVKQEYDPEGVFTTLLPGGYKV